MRGGNKEDSGFKTSRYYIVGSCQKRLLAFACGNTRARAATKFQTPTGISARQEWRLVLEP